MKGARSAAGLATLLVALGAPVTARALEPSSLRGPISLRFPGVAWVSTGELASWLAAPEGGGDARPVLLDARTEAEYAVSHLKGARRVDPESGAPLPGDLPEGAPVIVYCSVGYRSAAVARRLEAGGRARVYNLEGGIFQWANEGRPVYRDGAPVRAVHPYGRLWGRLLDEELRASP